MDRILKQVQDYIVKEQRSPEKMRQLAASLFRLAEDAEKNARFYSK